MKMLEEKIVKKPRKDWVCESCGKMLPKGEPLLQEKYVHEGKMLTYRYCLNKSCNPPNDVRYRLIVGTASVVVLITLWGVLTYAI